MNLVDKITKKQIRTDLPEFRVGDTVRVDIKIDETDASGKKKTRIQAFEGIVIKRHGGGVSETFTVRKVSYGVGVERTFPVHSPKLANIVVVKKGKVRRAKLNYIRKSSKTPKIKERV